MQILIHEPGIVRPDPTQEQRWPPEPQRGVRRERRKNREDRRRSVRDGVVVTLSTQPERRAGGERRKPGT
jgi:hypothetical protein